MKIYNIAIDGPSGAGKSTAARSLAAKLGIAYLDTGALYRAVGLKAMRCGWEENDAEAEKNLKNTDIRVEYENGKQIVYLDGENVSEAIRRDEVSSWGSRFSALPSVRAALLGLQRKISGEYSSVLDGRDIREYDVQSLYRMFGIIFQDFGKYAVTAKENIAFGDILKEMKDEEIKNAAHASDADSFIEKFSDGYDTPLMRIFEENGIELSIGQWQKLSIARAFYSASDVLILDEPTASLDPMAEQEIFNRFDSLRKDKTSIFVSHRLSSATTADKILVLEYGQLIESGTHKELMAAKGKYYELFSTQAKRYIESAGEISPEEFGGRRRRIEKNT